VGRRRRAGAPAGESWGRLGNVGSSSSRLAACGALHVVVTWVVFASRPPASSRYKRSTTELGSKLLILFPLFVAGRPDCVQAATCPVGRGTLAAGVTTPRHQLAAILAQGSSLPVVSSVSPRDLVASVAVVPSSRVDAYARQPRCSPLSPPTSPSRPLRYTH
jgi:hypothetical protein